MDRRTTIVLTLIGAALLVGAPLTWYLTQPPAEVGDVAALAEAPTADANVGTDTDVEVVDDGVAELPEPLPSPSSAGTLVAGELSGPLAHHPVPMTLEIPSLGAEAPVVPVALEDDGSMEIPDDVNVVGWYQPGVRPGQNGTAVLSGHVDSRTQGRGVLFDLRSVDVDDRIITAGTDGEPMEWTVVARSRYGKAELPIDDIFVWDGPPRLVVITCGGDYDAATRSYSDNVVVYAEPA